jgi:hypothetical protein
MNWMKSLGVSVDRVDVVELAPDEDVEAPEPVVPSSELIVLIMEGSSAGKDEPMQIYDGVIWLDAKSARLSGERCAKSGNEIQRIRLAPRPTPCPAKRFALLLLLLSVPIV